MAAQPNDKLYSTRLGIPGFLVVQDILDLTNKTTFLRHSVAAGTNGGSFTAGDDIGNWGRLRTLNTQTGDTSFCTLNAVTSQFVIQPGKYLFDGVQVPYRIEESRGALRDVTNGANLIVGENTYNNRSEIVQFQDIVEFSSVTTLEMRLKGDRTRNNTGFGLGTGFDNITPNIFATLRIVKL